MNYAFLKGLLAAFAALPALIVGSGTLASGPKIGDQLNAFHPQHVTGPDKGTNTCPVCKYGALPAVQVWVNSETPANVELISATLERAIDKVGLDHLRAFVVNVNPERERPVAISKQLTEIAEAAKLQNVALTYLDGPDAKPVAQYRINLDPAVKTTILVYRDRKVVKNFVNIGVDKVSLRELYEAAIADANAK